MLFLSVVQPESISKIQSAIELRLDLFPKLDLSFIQETLSDRPVLLTLRRVAERSEEERMALIEKLLELEPPFFDLEHDMDPKFLHATLKNYPRTKFILSYHNFQEVPTDLEGIYSAMRDYPAYSYKIAAMCKSTNDALKMLLFAKTHPGVSAICMGECGSFARVLGPVVGNVVDYACFDTPAGPGQLKADELIDIYNYHALNEETAIYGLIGDPVDKSIGHLYHNAVFRKRGVNAVYVKMRVRPEELAEFILLAKALGIRGLSVTMPLKELVLPLRAINTLRFDSEIVGINTDGPGALDAIEKRMPVQNKVVVLLGAGGAARGIADEAKARGADVVVLNRTVQRAKELGYRFGGLDEMPSHYDILINCLPVPIEVDILPKVLAMEIVRYPKETEFLQAARKKGCEIIYGEELFLNQAARQTAFWLE